MLVFLRVIQLVILYGGCAFLCYAPFRDKLRFSTATAALLTLIFSVSIACYAVLLVFVSHTAARSFFLLSLPLCGLFFLRSIKKSTYKSVLVLLLTSCYGAFICGCAVFIANVIYPDKGLGYELLYTIACLFLGGATYLPICKFMDERMVPMFNLVSDRDMKSVYLMPLFYIVLQLVFFTFYDTMGQMSDLVYFVVLVSVTVSTYFLVNDLLHILSGTVDKMRMREEISTAEKLLELQKNQYASWVTQSEAVRRARHDLKYHIAMIQTFLDKDDKDGLREHVNNFQRTLPETAPMMLCKNIDVNAILLHYYDRARKENIRLEMHANVEENISINSQDLAVVFGNCLENAFEACGRMDPAAERTVSLMAKPVGMGLAIIIDNTFDGKAVKENDVFLSSKRNKQAGIGMASVRLIVQKYAGIVSFETAGSIFMTSIRLSGTAVPTEVRLHEA